MKKKDLRCNGTGDEGGVNKESINRNTNYY